MLNKNHTAKTQSPAHTAVRTPAHTAARTGLIAVALGALTSSIATAAPTAWTMPSGSQTTFTYTNGQSLNGNFGTGNSTGSGFFTSPAGLLALASGGIDRNGSNAASDTLSVILNAKPLQQFGSVSTSILGDFATNGFAFVGASGQLRVFNLDNLAAGPQMMDLDFGDSFGAPIAFNKESAFLNPLGNNHGGFEGTASLALPGGWTNIRVELDGMVNADAVFSDSSSVIQAKDVSLDIGTGPLSNTTTQVPLPAAVFAAPIAAGIALKYRRKLVRA